jgi:hypothetical protein
MIRSIKLLLALSLLSLAYQAQAIIDPTAPPNTKMLDIAKKASKAQSPMQVTGVIKTTSGYKAIINHKIYQVGSIINGLTITKITTSDVFFSDNQTEFKMPITQSTSTGIQISKSAR